MELIFIRNRIINNMLQILLEFNRYLIDFNTIKLTENNINISITWVKKNDI
jgi:hypothetical protein